MLLSAFPLFREVFQRLICTRFVPVSSDGYKLYIDFRRLCSGKLNSSEEQLDVLVY